MNARHRWKAHQLIHREEQRTPDESVDEQPVFIRVDVRNPGVVPRKVQAVGRDDPVQVLQGSEVHRGPFVREQPVNVPADHFTLKAGGLSVGNPHPHPQLL